MYLKHKTCNTKIFIKLKNSKTFKNQGWKNTLFKEHSNIPRTSGHPDKDLRKTFKMLHVKKKSFLALIYSFLTIRFLIIIF